MLFCFWGLWAAHPEGLLKGSSTEVPGARACVQDKLLVPTLVVGDTWWPEKPGREIVLWASVGGATPARAAGCVAWFGSVISGSPAEHGVT